MERENNFERNKIHPENLTDEEILDSYILTIFEKIKWLQEKIFDLDMKNKKIKNSLMQAKKEYENIKKVHKKSDLNGDQYLDRMIDLDPVINTLKEAQLDTEELLIIFDEILRDLLEKQMFLTSIKNSAEINFNKEANSESNSIFEKVTEESSGPLTDTDYLPRN